MEDGWQGKASESPIRSLSSRYQKAATVRECKQDPVRGDIVYIRMQASCCYVYVKVEECRGCLSPIDE